MALNKNKVQFLLLRQTIMRLIFCKKIYFFGRNIYLKSSYSKFFSWKIFFRFVLKHSGPYNWNSAFLFVLPFDYLLPTPEYLEWNIFISSLQLFCQKYKLNETYILRVLVTIKHCKIRTSVNGKRHSSNMLLKIFWIILIYFCCCGNKHRLKTVH